MISYKYHMNRVPYTYLVGWSKLNKWYYGVRYAVKCNPVDLWNPYKTSSKCVLRFIREHGDPDVKNVRKTFTTVDSAREWEHKVLRRMSVVDNEKWLNQTDNVSISMEASIKGGNMPKPEGFGEKIRKARLGTHLPEEVKRKISASHIGKPGYFKKHTLESKKHLSDIGKTKISSLNSFYGRKHSEETKLKISESKKRQSKVRVECVAI